MESPARLAADSPARAAAARAAADLVHDGMVVGLGSGRAVWAVVELLRGRDIQVAAASSRTEELLRGAGLELVEPDGAARPQLVIDGADEIDGELGLIKGGGGALLREKLLVCTGERFVVVCEASKRVRRLGETRAVPVEVVRYAWRDTRRRLLELVASAELRMDDKGAPVVTDEGHHLLDCGVPSTGEVAELAAAIKATVGVVEHGFFLGLASLALLGGDDGSVEQLER